MSTTTKTRKQPAIDITADVARLVSEQSRRNPFVWLTIPEVYAALRAAYPTLTLADMRKQLVAMHTAKTVSLHPWTLAIGVLPVGHEDYLIEHGRELKYYVSGSGMTN